jgi:short-subunit dehydrogenase
VGGARREARLRALRELVEREPRRRVDAMALDLTRAEARARLTAAMEAARGRLALVVNNAGFGFSGSTLAAPPARLTEMIELNVTALTELSHAAARIFVEQRRGGLINVASTAAFQAVPYMNVYSATKAYVLSFTEALAWELAERGVRVMALCPGFTASEFQQVAGVRRPDQRTPMSAAECVRLGLDDFEAGKTISITGRKNKVQVFGVWLAPRRLVLAAASRVMKGRGAD